MASKLNKLARRRKAALVFILQWHLTARCQQNCLHYYMKDEPTYVSEIENELDEDLFHW
jgi:MoaA/NifB/PqqE/SkfB family radical SAM enzyme